MKNLFSITLLSMLFYGCTKENINRRAIDKNYIQPTGKFVSYEINGVPVYNRTVDRYLIVRSRPDTFSLSYTTPNSQAREISSIQNIPMKLGVNEIVGSENFNRIYFNYCKGYMSINADDYSYDTYSIDSTRSNFIEVESYDPTTKEISGKFQMTLYREFIGVRAKNPATPYDDTVRITSGKFDVIAFEWP